MYKKIKKISILVLDYFQIYYDLIIKACMRNNKFILLLKIIIKESSIESLIRKYFDRIINEVHVYYITL